MPNIAYDTIDYRDHKIKIYQDDMTESPREHANDTTMICFHKRYNLGDKNQFSSNKFESWTDLKHQIVKEIDPLVIYPLYLYDHSGISISTTPFTCNWDSGQLGYICISKNEVRKIEGIKRITSETKKQWETILQCEVEMYNHYLVGDTFGYKIENKESAEIEPSCWGFYGHNHNESGLVENAKDDIDIHIANIIKKKIYKVKNWIKHKVPLIYREHKRLIY